MAETERPLMWDKMVREWAMSHSTHASVTDHVANLEKRIGLLRQALEGLSTNATNCKMCQTHNEIYRSVLARDDSLA